MLARASLEIISAPLLPARLGTTMASPYAHQPVPATDVFKPDIFSGKVVLVTGGGSGICYKITETLMHFGCKAAIVGRKADRLQEAAQQLSRDTGSQAISLPGDVRQYEAMQQIVKKSTLR